mmetsp:Transcript_12003/g.16303  ORF Transcript_12003/g.16303 Transcript_12003/m.16303 type:complete len:482 (-) Transcript_12003:484-1929(-)
MELLQKLRFLFLDFFNFSALANELLRDFLDLFDNETLGFSALLELVGESLVLRLHRFKQDKLFEKKDEFELGALQVALETVLLLLHLLDLFIEVIDVRVHLFHQLLLFVLELDHADLFELVVELAHVLGAALAVGEALLVELELDLFLLLDLHGVLGLLVGFSLRLSFLLSLGCCLLLFLITSVLVGVLRIDLALLQLVAVGLDVIIGHVELLLGVLDFLVDLGQNELLRGAQLAIDELEALIQALHRRDDVLLPHAQVAHLDVEVNLDLVDGTLKQDHLLTLLLIVNLLALRHFVILVHLQVVLAEGALGILNLGFLVLVFAAMHNFLSAQLVDLLLAKLSLDLSLLTTLVCVGLMDLGLAGLANGDDGSLGLLLGLVAVLILHVVEHLIVAHLILLLSRDLALKNRLELVDVVGEELGHLGHAEGRHVRARAHCLNRELLEVENVIELLFDFVQLHSVLLDLPLLLSFRFLYLLLRTLN